MAPEQKKQLHQQLWNIANELRGKMSADEFRDYILGFIFYKYLSEKIQIFANNLLSEDKIDYADIKEDTSEGKEQIEAIKFEAINELGYFLKPSELFHFIAQRGVKNPEDNIIGDLQNILTNIERSTMGTKSEEDFDKLFTELNLNSDKLGKTVSARSKLITKVLGHLDKIDFQLENSEIDVLGDAYEYLIAQFASGAGKKAGEFYTPQEVSRVLAKLVTVGKKRLKNVYDPTCGSGSLLLRVAKEVEEVGEFFGQESINTTYNLARMNMILHGVHFSRFNIKQEDTLEHPQHLEERFEAIVANPPFSAQWSANPIHLNDDRFSQYGKLAPKSKADYAFIQHMVYQLAENGTMAVVMPHGVLFRGNSEGHIRQFLVEEHNYLDAVIGLPENIFFGTDIPTCILVLKKCRKSNDDVLFIDANRGFEKVGKQNMLREKDIEKIIITYKERLNEEKYSYKATIAEIKTNKYDLNIPKYVKIIKKEKVVDLKLTTTRLRNIEINLQKTNNDIAANWSDFENSKNNDTWKEFTLNELLYEHKTRNTDGKYKEVFSVAKVKGVINQIEHLGRSYASEDISNYKVALPGDVIYTKSPTSGFPYGIIKQNKTGRIGVVSVLYAVYKPKNYHLGTILDFYFSSSANTFNYLNPLVHKGAKNTMNLNNDEFLDGMKIKLPTTEREQEELANLISLLDERNKYLEEHNNTSEDYKLGILEKMFS